MTRRRKAEGRFTVSGPDEDGHATPSVGAGISCAQTFAARHMNDEGEWTYYVRDLLGAAYARVTKPDGERVVETYVFKDGRPC